MQLIIADLLCTFLKTFVLPGVFVDTHREDKQGDDPENDRGLRKSGQVDGSRDGFRREGDRRLHALVDRSPISPCIRRGIGIMHALV